MRPLRAVLIALALIAGFAGCEDRKPIPVATVVVLPDEDAYQLNGQRMTLRQLAEELRAIADHNRRDKTPGARAIVRLSSRPGVDYDRVRAVEEFCNGIGLDKIEKGM
jgi:hypothetical protein